MHTNLCAIESVNLQSLAVNDRGSRRWKNETVNLVEHGADTGVHRQQVKKSIHIINSDGWPKRVQHAMDGA